MWWQWHQNVSDHFTSLQTDNHASPHHSAFTGPMPFLPPNQQRQRTEGTDEIRLLLLSRIHLRAITGQPSNGTIVCRV